MTQMIAQNLSPRIAQRMALLQDYAAQHPTEADLIQPVLADCARPLATADVLAVIHRLQRLYKAARLNVLQVAAVREAIQDPAFPLWPDYTAIPATDAQKDHLAKLMYEGDVQRRAPIMLSVCDYSRTIAERILERCVAEGDETDVYISDPLFQRRLLNNCDAATAEALAQIMIEPFHYYGRAINIRIEQTQQTFPDAPPSAAIAAAYNEPLRPVSALSRVKFYTLTILPTQSDAALDQLPYDDYVDLFFRMCAVDWSAVNEAHQVLIGQLNAGKHLRFTNNDGTDLSMDITGFTFCNSLAFKNVPGSEVFSAPHRESAEGFVSAKGRYLYNSKLMENLTFRFENGRVVEYTAEKGMDVLTEMMEMDEGAKYIGEIAFGTNPVLRTHLVNGLLTEKIGGSFHFALGTCYKFTDYMGVPVHVNNGNDSAIHEDMTVMLYGKQGCAYLDGELIMQDGRFLDPRLAVLNGTH